MAKKRDQRKTQDKPGRPSKYESRFCEELVEHMSMGGGLRSFASKINVNPDTVYEWTNVHTEFSDALKRGQASLELWFEALFKRMASGQLDRPVKINGKTVYKPTQGNAAAAIFMAQNMIHWRNRKAIELTGDGGGPVKYSDITATELKRIIKEGLEVLGIDINEAD